MTKIDEERLDRDPTYCPGISWSNGHATWRSPRKYAGFTPPYVNLRLPGSPDDEHQPERARMCRDLTRRMLAWWRSQDEAAPDYGTWGYLIRRYRTDEFSPYQDVKGNTRSGYDYCCEFWVKVIGHMKVEDLTYTAIKEIEKTMRTRGRSVSNIKRMMTMLRTVAKYAGFGLGVKEAREVSAMLSEMRFRNAAQRSVAPSREQVYAIIDAAEAAGDLALSVAMRMQFELSLRAVDVRGQWLDITPEEYAQGGIVRQVKRGRKMLYSRWQDGLTWEMFAPDLTSFTKVISKTEKSSPDPLTFDLTPLPDLVARLRRLRESRCTGPVVVTGRYGLPYTQTAYAAAFRRFRAAAGVPDEVRAMDLRAGGITEAKVLGVDPYSLRDAAQHSQVSTTDRYTRSRSETIGKVVALRQTNRK